MRVSFLFFLLIALAIAQREHIHYSDSPKVGGLSNQHRTIQTDEIGWPATNILKNNYGYSGKFLFKK